MKTTLACQLLFARIGRWVVGLAMLILLATAAAKLISVWKLGGPAAGSLARSNILVPWVSEGSFLVLASLAECLIVAILLAKRNAVFRFGLLAWFVAVSFLYRSIVRSTGGASSCGCTGVWSGSTQNLADAVGVVLLGILAAISLLGLAGTVLTHSCGANRIAKPAPDGGVQ